MAIKPLKTIKFPELPDTYTIPQVDTIPTQGSSNAVSSGGVYGIYETVYTPYTKYEQGGINATTGELITHDKISRSGVIEIDAFKSMTKPSGWSGRYVVYTDKAGTVIDSVHNISYNANITHTPESLLSLGLFATPIMNGTAMISTAATINAMMIGFLLFFLT